MEQALTDLLARQARERTELANRVMANPNTSEEEFEAAFQLRDVAYVESQQYSEEQLAELRWETMCGCNGDDSPYHTYFGL